MMTSIEPIPSNAQTVNETCRDDVPTVYKDLGTIICGQEVKDAVEVANEKTTPVIFTMLEEESNALDHFLAPVDSIQVAPRRVGKLKLTFVSHVPDTYYDRRYLVTDCTGPVLSIRVRARSLGPSIKPNHVTVKFFILRNVVQNAKRFELENDSSCPVRYQFETGEASRPFQIAQPGDILHGHSKVAVQVKFSPSKLGVYRKRIFCLIQYHPPVCITLIGVFNSNTKVDPGRLVLHAPAEETPSNNYAAFMANLNESNSADDIDPCLDWPMGMTKRTVRFVEAEVLDDEKWDQKEDLLEGAFTAPEDHHPKNTVRAILTKYYVNMASKSSDALKLINVSDSKEFYFEWSNENAMSFAITPRSGTLKENQKLDMKLHFDPSTQDQIFNGELDLRLFPVDSHGDEESSGIVILPQSLTLNVIGHSFSSGSGGWLEQCEIKPRNLTLPPCVPGQVTYATLLINRSGHLPVIFEFIPPQDSSIKIKPPLGYISTSHQIFVVEFNSSEKPEGTYTEPWLVAYNTPSKYLGRIWISAKIESPRIVVGNGNAYHFDTTLPGGVSTSAVPVNNPTGLRLRYELFVPDSATWIDIPSPCFELEPFAGTRVSVIFKPTEPKEYLDCVCCLVRPADVPDFKSTTSIEFRGSCQEGTLVCTPPAHDFGKPLFGTCQSTTIHIYNFTPILIHFRLSIADEIPSLDSVGTCPVCVTPSEGSIPGQSSITANVSITPNTTRKTTRIILCKLLESESGNELSCCKPTVLFSATIEGILPTFQIIDLTVDGGGPLISPDWLWKMLDVNGINRAARSLLPGREERLHVRVPEAPVDSSPIMVQMMIESKCPYDFIIEIKNSYMNHYKRSPTWASDTETEGYNFMGLSPSRIDLKARSREVIKMALTFDVFGTTFYEWSIKMSHDRVIRLRGEVAAYPLDEAAPTSVYVDPAFRFRPVFIGDVTPPVQLYWMYNNSPLMSSYVLDKAMIREATSPFCDIFDCLNPSGTIPPHSCLPLMFIFRPNELKTYTVETQLCVRVNSYLSFSFSGNGTMNYSPTSALTHEVTVPDRHILKQPYITIEPSVTVFTLSPILTLSSARRVFYLKNTSRDKIWAFRWHTFETDKIVRAIVEPAEGLVQPGESVLSHLTVESLMYPTSLSLSVPCDVTDYTALRAYKNALQVKDEVALQYADCFTITEKGTFTEIPSVHVPLKPIISHIFITVRVTIVDSATSSWKLYPEHLLRLEGEMEMRVRRNIQLTLAEEKIHIVNHTLEQMMWRILKSPTIQARLSDYSKRFSSASYAQILPGSEKESERKRMSSLDSLPKHLIQRVLETTVLNILKAK